MKNLRQYMTILLQVVLLLSCLAGNSGAALLDVGPTVPEVLDSAPPQHGYPLWYRDAKRVPLEICLSQAVSPTVAGASMCNLLPGAAFDPAAPIVFPGNFPDEAFWFAADANVKNGIIRAHIVLALEAAFSTGAVQPGKQISFARIRYVVDTPVAGTYRIIHPYGEKTFLNVPAGTHAIFDTEDIGVEDGIFTGALQGGLGPFLTWDSGIPINVNGELFIGDPNEPHTITGSPVGTNFFRVEGPLGSNLDGLGNDFVQTDLFAVTGKIHTDPIPTSLTVDKATYALDNTGFQVNAFATTLPVSNKTVGLGTFPNNLALDGTPSVLDLSGTGLTAQGMTTNTPADGKFYAASAVSAAPLALPTTVTVTNTADVPASAHDVPLVDEVMISGATYNPLSKVLAITASSLDKVNAPVLQASMPGMAAPLGTLSGGVLNVTFPVTDTTVTPSKTYAFPSSKVTVTSAKGGSSAASTSIYAPALTPATGATLTPGVAPPQPVGTAITFSATATGGDAGPYQYRFFYRPSGTTTYIEGRAYATTPTWTWNTAALPVGSYVVRVNVRHVGSTAPFEAQTSVNYSLQVKPATGATLTPAVASPQPAGSAITFGATATGGDAGPYEYRFFYRPSGTTTYTEGRAYSTVPTWSWNTAALPAGSYVVRVNVRHVGSTVSFESQTSVNYKLLATPATGATLTPAVASPQPAGSAITFSATATGGDAGPYEYRFYFRPSGAVTYTLGRAYSTVPTWSWNTAGLPAGSYVVRVDVRHVGSALSFEALKGVNFGLK